MVHTGNFINIHVHDNGSGKDKVDGSQKVLLNSKAYFCHPPTTGVACVNGVIGGDLENLTQNLQEPAFVDINDQLDTTVDADIGVEPTGFKNGDVVGDIGEAVSKAPLAETGKAEEQFSISMIKWRFWAR